MTIPRTILQNYDPGRELSGWLAEACFLPKGEYSSTYEIRIKTNSLIYEFPSQSSGVPAGDSMVGNDLETERPELPELQ